MGMGGDGKPPQWEWELPTLPWEFIPKGFILRSSTPDYITSVLPPTLAARHNNISSNGGTCGLLCASLILVGK